jgi:hypothetical protein
MTDLLVVSGVALWPAVDGAGIRTAGLAQALAGRFSVRVLAPGKGSAPDGVAFEVDALPHEEPVRRVVAAVSPQPRRGQALLGPRRSQALLQAVADHRPRAVLFAGSHLAAVAPSIDRPIFVDFFELAVRGPRSLESFKARWWEPGEARRAAAASATTAADVALLASWGARAVLVPNGSSASSLSEGEVAGHRPVPTWEQACAPLAEAIDQVLRNAPTRRPAD